MLRTSGWHEGVPDTGVIPHHICGFLVYIGVTNSDLAKLFLHD